jgi:hypothetical protein
MVVKIGRKPIAKLSGEARDRNELATVLSTLRCGAKQRGVEAWRQLSKGFRSFVAALWQQTLSAVPCLDAVVNSFEIFAY